MAHPGMLRVPSALLGFLVAADFYFYNYIPAERGETLMQIKAARANYIAPA